MTSVNNVSAFQLYRTSWFSQNLSRRALSVMHVVVTNVIKKSQWCSCADRANSWRGCFWSSVFVAIFLCNSVSNNQDWLHDVSFYLTVFILYSMFTVDGRCEGVFYHFVVSCQHVNLVHLCVTVWPMLTLVSLCPSSSVVSTFFTLSTPPTCPKSQRDRRPSNPSHWTYNS